ncbi:MAG: hypothetical protein HY832_00870 [Candidatus Aenigmarchaeota archaeon]|nr:hypothetical protein [Candidatus Aenigmarchaeota archaeon]
MEDLTCLETMMTLTISSAAVKDEKPVSLLIAAQPESGKTSVLMQFRQNKQLSYLTDCTAYGLIKTIVPQIENNKISHIVIPDLLKPLARSESTVKNFVTFMNALIEEGILDMSTYVVNESRNVAVRCGLITAITRGELHDRRHQWHRMGFLSRCVPFSYSLSPATVQKIFASIVKQEYRQEQQIRLALPKRPKDIVLPESISEQLALDTKVIAEAQDTYGFRLQKQFQTLLKASALLNKRTLVTEDDLKTVQDLLHWVNFDYHHAR